MINQILDEIKQSTTDLVQAKIDTPESVDIFKLEIIDLIISLSNAIQESSYNFAVLAMRDLTLFNNLKLRIKRITRHIGVVNELLAVHGVLSHSEMIKLAVGDKDLEQTMRSYLMPIFRQSKVDLIDSLGKLEKQLFEWKQEEFYQRQNNMIDAWLKFCQQSPSIDADVDVRDLPDSFYRVDSQTMSSRADLSNLTDTLIEISSVIINKAEVEQQDIQHKSEEILDKVVTQQEKLISVETPLEVALNNFFQALMIEGSEYQVLDALSTFEVLSPGCELDYWANSLVSCCRNDYSMTLNINFIEEIDPIFNGNSIVTNVIISRVGG